MSVEGSEHPSVYILQEPRHKLRGRTTDSGRGSIKRPFISPKFFRSPFGILKFIGLGFTISAFFLTQAVVALVLKSNPNLRLKVLTSNVSRFCALAIKILGVRIRLSSRLRAQLETQAALVVGNHLSYLDILVLASQIRLCFVTSVEMKETPFLGHITLLGGCLYVERRSKENLSQEIREITSALRNGHHVVVFPEATSTNGESVLRFRSPLFQAAIDAGAPVQPLALNYRTIDGVPLTLRNRDRICWYGDMTFHGHITDIVTAREIEVDVDASPLIQPLPNETPKDLAARAHADVAVMYRPLTTA